MDYSYKLNKISIDEGKESAVRLGALTGDSIYRKTFGDTSAIEAIIDFKNIKVNDMILIYHSITKFRKTSPINEIIEIEDNYIKFKTDTSVYELSREIIK